MEPEYAENVKMLSLQKRRGKLIYMIITSRWLEDNRACSSALEMFEKVFGEDLPIIVLQMQEKDKSATRGGTKKRKRS